MAKTPIIETHVRSRIRKTERSSFSWQVVKGVLAIVVSGILLALVWYVTRLPFFTITEVQVEGGETVSHDDVRAVAETALTGAYLLIIPKRFTYLYPHDAVIESVDKNERVHGVQVERVSRTQIRVSFLEYIPHALWCGDGGEVNCYFMTEDGYAFTKAPELMGGAFIRHVQEGEADVHEGVALQPEVLTSLNTFITELSTELGFRVSKVIHKDNGDATLYVNGGGMLFVTLSNELSNTLSNLKAILASEEFSHINPGNFEYIDMRFAHKAFVNEELPSVVASTTEATTTAIHSPE